MNHETTTNGSMKSPKSDALINALFDETGHVGQHNCPERGVKLCREIEKENAMLRESAQVVVAAYTDATLWNLEGLRKAVNELREILQEDGQ